jgi:hypothetical protein
VPPILIERHADGLQRQRDGQIGRHRGFGGERYRYGGNVGTYGAHRIDDDSQPARLAIGDSDEMRKAVEMLNEVKESI